MDHPGETYPPCPTRKFPNSLLEPCHRFRRQAPLRWLVVREAESQEFSFPWSSHRALLSVDLKLELRREESRHASHHSFTSSPGHGLPGIQFLFIGSRLCATLLLDFTSQLGPGPSASLHLHPVAKRTGTSKLWIMLGAQKRNGPQGEPFLRSFPNRLVWPARRRMRRRSRSRRRR